MFFHELLMPKNNSNLFSSDHTQFTSKSAYFGIFLTLGQGPMGHGRLEYMNGPMIRSTI